VLPAYPLTVCPITAVVHRVSVSRYSCACEYMQALPLPAMLLGKDPKAAASCRAPGMGTGILGMDRPKAGLEADGVFWV
jgi:hypothetical protein